MCVSRAIRRVSVVRRDSAFRRAGEALNQLEASKVKEAEALAAECERLTEAWKLFHETVERGCRENATAQEEHAAVLDFAADIRDSAIREVEKMLAPLQAARR